MKNQTPPPHSPMRDDERGSIAAPSSFGLPHFAHNFTLFFRLWHKTLEVRTRLALYIAIVIVVSVQLSTVLYFVHFFTPKQTHFSYATANCQQSLVILPRLHSQTHSRTYNLHLHDYFTVNGYPLFSRTLCIEQFAVGSPEQIEAVSLAPFGFTPIAKSVAVLTPELPQLLDEQPVNNPISLVKTLNFTLTQNDAVFAYWLTIDGQSIACNNGEQGIISCDTTLLALEQGSQYPLELSRSLNQTYVDTPLSTTVNTISAVRATNASVSSGSIIFDKSRTITIDFDKPLQSIGDITFEQIDGDMRTSLDTEIQLNDYTATITPGAELVREASFELTISNTIAQDGSTTSEPFTIAFTTSGGPRVTSVNIPNYGAAQNTTIVLTLDTPLKAGQDLNQFIALTNTSGAIPFAATANSNTITIAPLSPLGFCSAFTISLRDGIQSAYDISGGSAWQFSSRTVCRSTSVIGTSVNGRNIIAYRFGNGPKKILYFGNMHGNESSSKYILDSWTSELEANFHKIAADHTIIVVPTLNPDGLAAGTRYNARNVDLNRNFAANNWKPDVIVAGGQLVEGNGGSSPLSEPESQALANLILTEKPQLILSYHARGSLIIANESGNSVSLGASYGSLSGLWAPSPGESGDIFNYETTGTLEGWTHDKLGIPTLVIELSTYSSNEFWRHKSAMWSMAQIP